LRDKYFSTDGGGIGNYTSTAPVGSSSEWTKNQTK